MMTDRLIVRGLLLAVCLSLHTLGAAAPATVRIVQAPAWLERDGAMRALRPGMPLDSGDRIRTGERARVLISLEEGSLVKLGADAELDLARLLPPADETGVFEGFLDVLKGAFRFTTTVAGRKRNIDARLRSATIGIRGTDVWGKAEDSRDFVVLLEGSITIEREGERYPMDTPLNLFMAPRGESPLPIGPVDPDDLAVWAQETEPQEGAGIRDGAGPYVLNLASFGDEAQARALVARLAEAGYAADAAEVSVDGRAWWRVSSPGYASRADAEAVSGQLAGRFALASPWITDSP